MQAFVFDVKSSSMLNNSEIDWLQNRIIHRPITRNIGEFRSSPTAPSRDQQPLLVDQGKSLWKEQVIVDWSAMLGLQSCICLGIVQLWTLLHPDEELREGRRHRNGSSFGG
jgi:hypothetical protein